jgi:hypothetical protein
VRAFVVWESVLPTDWASPSTAALRRISDIRTSQFWDKRRMLSHLLGEHDRRSVVWDYIAVYNAGEVWRDQPPKPLYEGKPLVKVTGPASSALAQALQRIPPR